MSARRDAWRARAYSAYLAARAADSGSEAAHYCAYMAETAARLNSWTHSHTQSYLARLYALANPDGGWGLSQPYDAFGDGSVNPASTTYTVTLAGHVGPVLLNGYRAGAVPRAKVQGVIDLLMSTPRIPVEHGQCVAYSRDPSDAQPGYEVHNVSAGVAWYLHQCAVAGLGATGMHRLITDITIHQAHAYRADRLWWPYIADGDDQDPDHQSYSALSMYPLLYWPAREAVYHLMSTDWTADPLAAIVYARLAGCPGGVASWSRTTTGLTLWLEMADQWTSVIDDFVASAPGARRLAQIALYSARAWANCP